MNAIELLRSSRDELLRANPEAEHGISIGGYGSDLEIGFHGVKSYAEACTILRRLGVQKWNKFPNDGCSYITGNISEGLEVTVDTGEFIEVTKTRIVCSDPTGETKPEPVPF